MKKTKILALGLAALMGLAPVTACSQGGSGESSEPQSSQTESAGGENNSGADQPKSTGRFTPYGRKIFPLTSAWITSLKSIRLR